MHRILSRSTDPLNSPCDAETWMKVSTLWIIGPSLGLHQKLVRTSGLQDAIIFRQMPCPAGRLSSPTLDRIADAIASRDVRCIVVCGQPSDAAENPRIDQCSPQDEKSRYHVMLQRIRARGERQQRAEEQVLSQLDQIRTHARVTTAFAAPSMILCGMFYIPESDAFLYYDPLARQFVPIMEAGRSYS